MKKVACYVRVSTEEQKKHGLSVDSQIVALKDWADQNNYEIVNYYNDAGLSASVSYKKRKALLDMIADCQKGKIDLIIFTKLDRFFRSVPDYYACIEQMNDIPWKAIWEDYETETSAGKFKVNIMLAIAQAESERTSERIKSVLDYKRAKGQYIGGIPTGYKVENHCLVIDENTQEAVKAMFDAFLATHSTAKACEALAKYGITKSIQNIRRSLRLPVYAGILPYGECDAYITKEEHLKILDIWDQEKSVRTTPSEFLFKSLCYCSICGNRMRSRTSKYVRNNNVYRYCTYSCDSGYRDKENYHFHQISESIIERYLLAEIDGLIGQYNLELSVKAKSSSKEDAEKQIKKLQEKERRIGVRFEDGNISEEEYKSKISEIRKEISSITFDVEPNPVELPSNWKDIYEQLDKAHRHQFWLSIIDKIVIDKDKSIKVLFF